MKLYDLLENRIETYIPDVEITGVTDDSRKVEKGSLFVCVKGEKFDGHSFAEKAVNMGAYVVTDHDMKLKNQIIAEDTRKFYGELCASWFGHPEKKMKLIGVTGTNGKTTMTKLIKEILSMSGHKVGLLGTIQNEIGSEVMHTDNTTPFAYDFYNILSQMYKGGCDSVVMEVSSFALIQHRIGPAHFRVAVFTNLTQDHLDYHKTMEEYYKAKKMLFSSCDTAIINIDDDYGKRLYEETDCSKFSYSTKDKADFYAKNIVISAEGSSFDFIYDNQSYPVSIAIPGDFNVSNSVAAVSACIKLGIPVEKVIKYISQCKGVKGRCEVIPTGKNFSVICDYAHTPDAIENILSSVKKYTEGRLFCLFGCGGNRDKTKRPKMAAAAAKYADYLIVTSDNPRDEDPDEIIKEVLTGLSGYKGHIDTITDRTEAIAHAVKIAKKGDVIVLAGKGHEDYQVLKDNVHIHMDEREIVRNALKSIG